MGAFESGQAFLAGVLAKLPADKQAQAKALFEDPAAKDAVIVIGDGALARPEMSRALDDIKAKEADLAAKLDSYDGWFKDNEAALKEYLVIKPEYDTLKGKTTTTTTTTEPVDPEKVVRAAFDREGPAYLQVAGWLTDKAQEHRELLGERLNTSALLAHPKLGRPIAGQPGRVFNLEDAYTETYGEKVAAKQKELTEKTFNDEVQKRLAEERAKQVNNPFPLRSDASPSVLDVLNTEKGSAAHTLDTAVGEYERLQAARG